MTYRARLWFATAYMFIVICLMWGIGMALLMAGQFFEAGFVWLCLWIAGDLMFTYFPDWINEGED